MSDSGNRQASTKSSLLKSQFKEHTATAAKEVKLIPIDNLNASFIYHGNWYHLNEKTLQPMFPVSRTAKQ